MSHNFAKALYGGSAVAVASAEPAVQQAANELPNLVMGLSIAEFTAIVAAAVAVIGLIGSLWSKRELVRIEREKLEILRRQVDGGSS